MAKINVKIDVDTARALEAAAHSEGVSVQTVQTAFLCQWVTHTQQQQQENPHKVA